MYNFIKRFFDILVCLLGLPVFLLLFLVVGIAIKLDDKGPVFYKAARIGRNGSKFHMLKFRSMKVGAKNIINHDGSTYNSKNDTRVTSIGKFIRETSIDETPQILNVLLGEMSLIGPRASGYEALKTYKIDEIDKMKIKPGITGYTQAYFRNNLSVREKRLKDAWYANNYSFRLDVNILLKTFWVVFNRKNIYTN